MKNRKNELIREIVDIVKAYPEKLGDVTVEYLESGAVEDSAACLETVKGVTDKMNQRDDNDYRQATALLELQMRYPAESFAKYNGHIVIGEGARELVEALFEYEKAITAGNSAPKGVNTKRSGRSGYKR